MNSRLQRRRAPRRMPPTALLLLALSALLQQVASAPGASAQAAPEPRREQLLNGLRILIVHRPGDPNVLLRLRVHSGAAFDLANKEGLAALLADALFNAGTREFVREDLDGRIEVATSYDAVDITLGGRATDFERFVDLARNGLTNTDLSPDVVTKLREAHLKAEREAKRPPAEVADRAVAARLFGKHPYGRSVEGTPESLARVERADLMLARERFLNPDNTTLVIVGGVEPRAAMRQLRQSFGAWTKSNRVVPSTFRQPDPPDARTLVIDSPGASGVEVRLAVRGLARADRDAPAARLLVPLVRKRWATTLPMLETGERKLFVRHDAHTESGLFLMGATVSSPAEAARTLEAARKVLAELAGAAPSAADFEAARQAAVTSLNEGANTDEALAEELLVEHTYKTRAVTRAETARSLAALTPEELQRVAARLFLHTPSAAVAVGEAARLSEELARAGGVEVFGQAPAPAPPPATTSTKPPVQLKRP